MTEIERRRTFAIISHPDAGKTTLTEKFLLFGGQIQVAGAVILLLKYFSNTYKSILQEYFSDGEPAIRDDDDNIILKKSIMEEIAQI